MERRMAKEQPENPQELAAELLQQAERCVSVGLLEPAQILLTQVWTIGVQHDLDIANTAAWGIACLLVRLGCYDQSAEWFKRVAGPPVGSEGLWATTMEMLEQACQGLAANLRQTSVAQALPAPSAPAADMPALTIRNLGCFQVIRDGTPLPVCKARKSIALFRYVLTRRHRTAHKEELMELLWPNAHPREAAHSLHVAVNALRRYIDPRENSYLLFEAGYYTINPDAPVEIDCDTFEALINEAEAYWRANDLLCAEHTFSQAIASYQGDYVVDAHDMTWAVAKRERLLGRYLTALEHLGQICFNQRLFEQAADCYQRLLERDGYREDAHCQLMRCYSELGRRNEALQQYKRCAFILANDLALEPMQETQALYRLIAGADG
jgi:DNA-binding SARP family transcriptional activator